MESHFTVPQKFAVLFHALLGFGITLILADYLALKVDPDDPEEFIQSKLLYQHSLQSFSRIINGTTNASVAYDSGGNYEIESLEEGEETSIYGGDSFYGEGKSEYFFSVLEVQRLSRIEQELIPCLFKLLKRLESFKSSSSRDIRLRILRFVNQDILIFSVYLWDKGRSPDSQ